MIGQSVFYASGPVEVSGNTLSTNAGNLGTPTNRYSNLYLTGTGFFDETSSRKASSTSGDFTNLSANNLISRSGVFDYLAPTGRFFPPLLTLEQRTGLFSGYLTTGITPFDGLLVYQINSGQKLMTVQSGIWKTVSLS